MEPMTSVVPCSKASDHGTRPCTYPGKRRCAVGGEGGASPGTITRGLAGMTSVRFSSMGVSKVFIVGWHALFYERLFVEQNKISQK